MAQCDPRHGKSLVPQQNVMDSTLNGVFKNFIYFHGGGKENEAEVKPGEEKDTIIYSSRLKSCVTFFK